MRIYPFQAAYPDLTRITSPDSFFELVKEGYLDYSARGVFQKSPREAIFLYQIRTPRRRFTGLIACTDLRDYLKGHIRGHEHTLALQEKKQLHLLLQRRAEVKPVLLIYRDAPDILTWSEATLRRDQPFLHIHFEQNEEEHLLWEIRDPGQIRILQDFFAQSVPSAYIADGHHRTTTSAILFENTRNQQMYEPEGHLLCALFPASEVCIHEFNRVVEAPPGLAPERFLEQLSTLFDIERQRMLRRPVKKHQMLLILKAEGYLLHWKAEVLERYHGESVLVDSRLLNELVLRDLLLINDVRTDPRLDYIEGPEGVEGVLRKTERFAFGIGFCLFPVAPEDLMRLSDEGKALPPKSTWFEPRMKNGLLVHEL